MTAATDEWRGSLLGEVEHAFRVMVDAEERYVEIANSFQETVTSLRDAVEQIRLAGITDIRQPSIVDIMDKGIDLKRIQRILDGLQHDAQHQAARSSG